MPVKLITTITKIQKFTGYYCLVGNTDGVDVHLIADDLVMDVFGIREGHKYEITGMGYSCVGRMKVSRARLRVEIEKAIEIIRRRNYDETQDGDIEKHTGC